MSIKMYATIDIGNPRMTHKFLKGNPCMLMYAVAMEIVTYNTRVVNGNSRVRTRVAMRIVVYAIQHLEK